MKNRNKKECILPTPGYKVFMEILILEKTLKKGVESGTIEGTKKSLHTRVPS